MHRWMLIGWAVGGCSPGEDKPLPDTPTSATSDPTTSDTPDPRDTGPRATGTTGGLSVSWVVPPDPCDQSARTCADYGFSVLSVDVTTDASGRLPIVQVLCEDSPLELAALPHGPITVTITAEETQDAADFIGGPTRTAVSAGVVMSMQVQLLCVETKGWDGACGCE